MLGENPQDGRADAHREAAGAAGLMTYGTMQAGASANPVFNIAEYWRLALKHRLVIGCTFVASLVIGIAVTLLMTPIYTASTTVQIDREAARVLDVAEVQPRESMVQGEEFFQTQYGILRSRSLAEQVIDNLGLASSDAFLVEMGASDPEIAEGATAASRLAARREAVLEVVQANLGVIPVRGSRLVAVTFNSPDPVLSARIANAFASNFIQANLDRKYQSSSYARTFLEERLAQTKATLENAERALVSYAAAQQIINIQDGDTANDRTQSLAANNLVALNEALADATAQRVSAEEKWRQARTSSPMSLPEVLQNLTIQGLTEMRAKTRAEYEQKSRIYQADWPELVQLRGQLDELDSQINATALNVRQSIQGQYTVALNQERSLRAQVNGLKGDVLDLRFRSVQYNILQRDLDTNRTLYDGLLQRYKEVGITGGVTTNNISIIDPAEPPAEPSKPDLLLNILLAIILGLGLGVVIAFLLEALDQSLATPDDVESKLGIPVLGVIPLFEKGDTALAALADTRSPFSEAYYSLRTALQFSTGNGAPRSLLVTSASPAEGKSTTAYAIALNFARIGKRVLLIDGDLRNPSMHRVVGVDNDRGMSNLLAGSAEIGEVARNTPQANLDIISSGPLPPSPAELWGGDRLRRLLDELKTRYDHVVIDGPPILGFADAPILTEAVEGTLFIVSSRGVRRAQARGALRRLAFNHSSIIGAVLTKFDTKASQYGSYDYAYDYNYGSKPATAGAGSGKKGKRD
ncbi:GumC family protein [Brevundimonas sp. TWP2-3-4b2]|uniref:GumC family protein n=1 Tax=Brevundimonas sp. TWP2-3-4b2 TaxID=2804595 RepID=UPI003CF937FF